MKNFTATLFAITLAISSLAAQNYMVVNSKTIFESVEEYTKAITTIDNLAKEYQAEVDKKFDNVEAIYNSYMQRANSLNSVERGIYEKNLSEAEAAATAYQESIFANGGVLFKKRLEILTPIQDRVFAAIEAYAQSKGFDLVLDETSSSTILYKSPNVDHTAGVIEQLKNKKQ